MYYFFLIVIVIQQLPSLRASLNDSVNLIFLVLIVIILLNNLNLMNLIRLKRLAAVLRYPIFIDLQLVFIEEAHVRDLVDRLQRLVEIFRYLVELFEQRIFLVIWVPSDDVLAAPSRPTEVVFVHVVRRSQLRLPVSLCLFKLAIR